MFLEREPELHTSSDAKVFNLGKLCSFSNMYSTTLTRFPIRAGSFALLVRNRTNCLTASFLSARMDSSHDFGLEEYRAMVSGDGRSSLDVGASLTCSNRWPERLVPPIVSRSLSPMPCAPATKNLSPCSRKTNPLKLRRASTRDISAP